MKLDDKEDQLILPTHGFQVYRNLTRMSLKS